MMKIYTFLFLNLIALNISFGLKAQTSISGKIRDAAGQPLLGVGIGIKGTLKATTANDQGDYTIIARPTDSLVFSYVGFITQRIYVGDRKVINVTLLNDDRSLSEVVVVGYGQQKKQSVVGAISRIEGDELMKAGGVTNLSSALTGLAPGVTTLQGSGEPGRDQAQILIRGKATWGNTNPLILVDGIERDFNDIDPQEVESVSILKDASATAVFGVKGANGVILVTTKRGKEGLAKISITTNLGIKQPTYRFDLLDHATSMELANEAWANDGQWNNITSPQYINNWRNKVNPAFYPEISWSDELIKDAGYSQQYNINFSGGTKFVKYFTSLGYLSDGDIFRTTKQPEYDPSFQFQRYNYRSNLDFTVTPTTTLSLNLAGNVGLRQRPNSYQNRDAWDSFGTSTMFKQFYTIPNYVFPIQYPDGTWGNNPANRWDNLVLNLNQQGNGVEKSNDMFSDLLFKQDLGFLTKGLTFQSKLSYNSSFAYRRTIAKEVVSYYYRSPDDQTPQRFPDNEFFEKPVSFGGENIVTYNRNLYYEFSLNYNKKIQNHSFSILALMLRNNPVSGVTFPSYQESWVGRATYNFKDRYFAEFNSAYNGSEKFAPGLRFGFFPSYAVGWLISEEPLVKNNLKFINYLKVRFSYGKVGSDIGAPRFTYTSDYASGGSAPFGNESLTNYGPLYYEGGAANKFATWETATKQNLGLEFKSFNNRFFFNADLYNEKRNGILMVRRTIPIWFGQGNPSANIGETKNHGYELEAGWNDKIGAFSYGLKANYTFTESRVLFRDDPANIQQYQAEAGKPIGWNSMLLLNGMYNSWNDVYNSTPSSWSNALIPGDFKYVDYNGDGIINEFDFAPNGKLSYPSHTFGLTLNAGYKNFALSAMFYGVSDVAQQIPYELLWEFPGNNSMAWPYSVDRWTAATASTATRPSLHMQNNRKHNEQRSTFNYADASYLRLRTLEASYIINIKALKRTLNINSWQIYVNGNNLFTISDFDSRIDPEAANTGAYPLIRRYNIGMRVSL